MKKEKILKEYKAYETGGLTHATNELLNLFSVSFSEAEVCECGRPMLQEAKNYHRCMCGRSRWISQT